MPVSSSLLYTHSWFFRAKRGSPTTHTLCTRVQAHLHSFQGFAHPLRKTEGYAPLPFQKLSQAWQFTFGDCETPITNHEPRVGFIPSQVTAYSGFEGRRPMAARRRSPATCHWHVIYDRILKTRNAFEKPSPQTLHPMAERFRAVTDCGCILRTSLKSGFASTNPEAGEANSCNPLLQSF